MKVKYRCSHCGRPGETEEPGLEEKYAAHDVLGRVHRDLGFLRLATALLDDKGRALKVVNNLRTLVGDYLRDASRAGSGKGG